MSPAEAKRREALDRRILAMQTAYGADVRQIVNDAFKAGKDTGWEDRGVHDERIAQEKPTDGSQGTDAEMPSVPATPIKPAERITPDQLIADGRVVRGSFSIKPGNYRNDVWMSLPDGNGADLRTNGVYRFENVYCMGGQSGFVTPHKVNAQITMRNCGVFDIVEPANQKGQGCYFDGCELDIDGFVASNIAWRADRPNRDQSHGIYAKDCSGTIRNVLGDRIQFAGVKRSTNGDVQSKVRVERMYVTRTGCITNLSTSSFDDRFGKQGWHTDSPTVKVGGERLGRWVRLEDGRTVWEVFGVMLRGGDETCHVYGVWIGPTQKPAHARPAVSDADVEPVGNIHAAGWGNLAAPSLLPGGMSVEEWGNAIRGGFREDLLPEVLR